MENIYNAIQNLYSMDKTTWQEVLAELYNLVSKVENKFDLFELKFGSLLGEQVTRELKKMYDDGSLASLINDKLLKDINAKVDAFKTEVSEQLDTKAYKIKVTSNDFGDNDTIQEHTEILNNAFQSGKSVLLDNKQYNISSSLEYKNNICIDGNNASITPTSEITSGSNVSYISSKNNITISNLIFEGNRDIGDTSDGVHPFDVWNSNNIIIDRCTFRDNAYVGSRYFNCNNIKILNSNFENVDCGIITLGDTANNFFISNCYFNGHSMSEPISFYCDKLMKNININNCTMENKSTMAILLGRENGNLNSMVDGFTISNITTRNVLRAISFSQCKNGSVSNISFNKGDDYGHSIFYFNYAENIKVSNCLCNGSSNNSVIVSSNSKNIDFSNMTLIEPGGGNGQESQSRFFELNGSHCNLDNIICISTSSECDKNIYVYGSNNVLSNVQGVKNGSEAMNIFLEKNSSNNTIINPIGFNVFDKTLNYTTSTTNRVVRSEWKYGTTALSDLSYQVYNKFYRVNQSNANWDINKLSLYAEGESIQYVIVNKYHTDMTLTLGGPDSNIIFKNTDTITLKTNETIKFEFVVRDNKWVEISRQL